MQLALESRSNRSNPRSNNPHSELEPTSWIAARYEAASLPDEMLLGDGSMPGSGDYFNRPLLNYVPYRVFLRAITVTNVSKTLSLSLSLCLPLPPLSLVSK